MFLGSKVRPVRGAGNLISRLSRQCGIVNISQSYGPPQPVMGIALLFFFFIILVQYALGPGAQPLTQMSTGNIKKIMFLGSIARLVPGADNLTAIYEPIV
jgi:hypothetical protein